MHHFSWVSYKKALPACQYSVLTVVKLLSGLLCSNVKYRLCRSLLSLLFIFSAVSRLEHFVICEWKYVKKRRNGQRLQSLKVFEVPYPEHPWCRSTFYCQEFYLAFSFCCCVRQENFKYKIARVSFTNTPSESIHTPQIQRWQNWKMSHHNRASQSDDTLGFSQPSLTHQ